MITGNPPFLLKLSSLNKHLQHSSSERGQVLVLVVLGLVALIAITALAVDGGNVLLDIRKAQNAADSAALASALARIRGEDFVQRAYEVAKTNGYTNDGVSSSVQVFSPPISGEHVGDIEYIQVIITSNVDTYFASVVGQNTITNKVSAVSRTSTPEITELLKGYAVISLAPTSDCDNKKSFWVHGEATLDVTGGGIFVNSNHPECALITQGSGSIRIRDNSQIVVVGGASIQKPEKLTPYPPQTGGVSIPYPPPFFLPKISCDKDAKVSEDGYSMSAGNWNGTFPPEGVTHLNSGTYCVNEFIVENGTSLTGIGVTIVVEKGKVRWPPHSAINLYAPKSGDLAGLLLYLPIDNHNKVQLNGGEHSSIKGTILAPGSTIHINGMESKDGFHSQIIGYRIDADGLSNVIIKYIDEQNYDAYNMPEIQLAE